MKPLLILFVCLAVSIALGDNQFPHKISEHGERPLGYHITAEEGVDHHPPEDPTPIVNYYVVDKSGEKRSKPVGSAVLGREDLFFQWTNQQKCLIVIHNGRASGYVDTYALDSKGNFKTFATKLDSPDTRKKVAIATQVKGHPEWSKMKSSSKESWTSTEGIYGEDISVEDSSVGDASFIMLVHVSMDSEWVTIRYRFDAQAAKFTRLDASLVRPPNDHKVTTLSNDELEKAIKNITFKKE